MKEEIHITDYETFLKAKEKLKEDARFHKHAASTNIKEGAKMLAITRIISLSIDKLFKSHLISKIDNILYLKSLSKTFLKSWLRNFVLQKINLRKIFHFN